MKFEQPFDTASTIQDFGPLPSKWYLAQITNNKDRATAAGGMQTSYEYTILGPDNANRKVFSNHNLKCSSSMAMDIARRECGQIGFACGLANMSDTYEVVGKKCEILVTIEKDQNGTERNRITRWRVPNEIKAVAQPVQTPVQPAPAPQQKPAAAPWFS